jgi:hypothetical protein
MASSNWCQTWPFYNLKFGKLEEYYKNEPKKTCGSLDWSQNLTSKFGKLLKFLRRFELVH